MALRFADGFDHYLPANAVSSGKWSSTTASTFTQGTGRFGGYCMYMTTAGNSTSGITKVLDSQSTWIVGFAWYSVNPTVANTVVQFRDGATVHVDVRQTATGYLQITRNATVLGTCTATALQPYVWYYIEFKCNISDGAGAPVLRINGVQEPITWATGTATTQDTRNAGNATADRILFGNVSGGNMTWQIDDVYICDSTGSAPNNDFLGDVKVESLFPNGNGTTSNLTGSDGNTTDNYLLVDEIAPSTADYVESSDVGNKDTYAFSNLSSTAGTIYGVQLLPYAAKSDAGTRSIGSVALLSGTESVGPTGALSATQLYYPRIMETDPTGATWTIANVNSAEFGVKVLE